MSRYKIKQKIIFQNRTGTNSLFFEKNAVVLISVYNYSRYKILTSPDSRKTQGLQLGDVVRRQYFDPPSLICSLMVVLETGTDIIGERESHYFIGALIEGDEPKTGELLDFVRITSLFDSGRSGALYLTVSDAESPYMDVIDGMATENSLCYPTMDGDWAEIADLNIVLQADLASFASASKARIGKVKGIIDPVFGVLEGYGAYFQNLYATQNVNIAGTLTAGDENGFSYTFYVGKIHKNVILNSIAGIFNNGAPETIPETTPAGMGYAWQMGLSAELKVQSSQWRDSHEGLKYCFSLWLKAEYDTVLSVFQDRHFIGNITVNSRDWKRYRLAFRIKPSATPDMLIRMESPAAGLRLTSPQLEAGTTPSQYQPTDGTLSYEEDYGAWFSKGGIGGTIQNPLLRLNEDGSISSRDNSFVIRPDGTGHFASGRFNWTKDTIILQDVTIRWEDFDEEAQENMLPKSVSLTGADVFHYPDELENDCEPAEIIIYAAEHNFTASERAWQYLDTAFAWKSLQGENRDFLKILPGGHYWEERKVLSVKYIAVCEDRQYKEIFTVRKQLDGRDSCSVYIASTGGTVFKNGIVGTTLVARVMKGGQDVTDKIPESGFLWKRTSGDAATLTPGVKSGSVKWYKNGTEITSGQDGCTVAAAAAKYALTINTNHMSITAPQARYTFEAVYVDANGLEIAFRAEIQFTQHQSAGCNH